MTRAMADGQRMRRRLSVAVGRRGLRLGGWGPGAATPAGLRQLHLLIALIAPALMFATIWFMAAQQNGDAHRLEMARAVNVERYLLDRLATLGADNANWDEAYDHAGRRVDARWIDGAWGPAAYGTIDLHDAFLLDARGRSLYGSILGARSALQPAMLMPNGLKGYVEGAARAAPPRGVAGFARYADGMAVVNVTRLRPARTAADPALPPRYLMMVKRLDAPTLAEVERTTGFHRLRFVREAGPPGTSVPLRNINGVTIGALTWRSDAPGFESALAVLPVALFVFALLAYAGFSGASAIRQRTDELLSSQRQALRLAHCDALTDLANRRGFAEELERNLARGGAAAMLYMDLDGFKEVNDAFGHAVGDQVLVQAARRIAAVAGPGAPIARFGGDEFAVMLTGDDLGSRAHELARAVVEAFVAPIEALGHLIYVGASVGVALSDGADGAELIRRADVAMYVAKSSGKRRWRAYDEGMDRGRAARRQIAAELRQALADGALLVSFQPIVDAATHETVGCEALARWSSPTLGVIDPALFISVAEEAGIISELTRQVLRQACAAGRAWGVQVAVNLSAAEVWDLAFADELLRILSEAKFPAARLDLEITESYLTRDPEAAADTLGMLRALGVNIVLDDFGMGFASLGQLRRLPLDRIKLTHEFLSEIPRGGNAAEVATAIVALAKALDLPVTASGVETEEQEAMLTAAGCARLQGWLHGKPMSAAAFTRRLKSERAEAATA